MDYFDVVNWSEYQHYKDRDPPWIKLHFKLLTSRAWTMLDNNGRALAIACMLIASRNHGQVPNDPDYIKRVAYFKKAPDFAPLVKCGFLAVASGCKQTQAKDTQETEAEEIREETERESEALSFSDCPKDMDTETEVSNCEAHYAEKGQKVLPHRWNSWVAHAKKSGAYAKRKPRHFTPEEDLEIRRRARLEALEQERRANA